MAKIITITSGKGGVGKTTSTINLSAALNHFGKEVIIIDANLTTPNIGIHLGSPNVPIYLNHALIGKNEAKEALYLHKTGIKIVPSSLSLNHLRGVKPEKLIEVAKELGKFADFVIIDSAAGLGREAISAIKTADEIIIITQAEIAAITDALKTIKLAEKINKKVLGVIITRFRNNEAEMNLDDIRTMLDVKILGIVPEDNYVKKALNAREPVFNAFPKSDAARSYKKIVAKILGDSYVKRLEDEESILHKFLKRLKIKG